MFKVRFKTIKSKLTTDLKSTIKKVLKWGMFKSEYTAKKEYLTGPRPEKLGVVTGRLLTSIKTRVFESGKSVVGEIGTNVIYARRHEEGTGGMPKRAFLQPSLQDNLEAIKAAIEQQIFNAWNK